MADISDINSALQVKIVGQDGSGVESTPVQSTTLGEIKVSDVPDQVGLSGVLTLTTTAIEGKVGASALVNRKYVEMQALTSNVKWGYETSCPFDLFKSQFFSLPAGPNCKVYFKMSSGSGSVAIGEK